QSMRTNEGAALSSKISATTAFHLEPLFTQGLIRSRAGMALNQVAKAFATPRLVSGFFTLASNALSTAPAIADPRRGGTAFPICLNAALGGPANRKSSGKVCRRAASRTVNVRDSRG